MLFWFIVFLIALIVELLTTALVSIWFSIGALFALAISWMGLSIVYQGIIFMIISILALVLTKPFVEKRLLPKGKIEKTNVDAVIGSFAVVTVEINNLQGQGEVKVGGKQWTARNVNEEVIAVGETVIVERIEGVKAIVSTIKEKKGE